MARRSKGFSLAWYLLAGASALAVPSCFDSGTRWQPLPAAPPPADVCVAGSQRCAIGQLQKCEGSPAAWVTTIDCTASGKICAPGLYTCTECIPGQSTCDGEDVRACNADGTRGEVTSTCDTSVGIACRAGGCFNLCNQATIARSNVGCEYWAVDLDNAMISPTSNAAAQQFAVVVSNPQPDVPTIVQVFQDDGQPGDAPAPIEIQNATISPLNLQVFKLGPREVDGSPDGQFNTGTHTALTRHAYKIVSSYPIVAYQFNPLENANVFSNDASLLKPREALMPSAGGMLPAYVVAGWPQTIAATDDPNTNFDPSNPTNLRAFLTIVGTRENTKVRVHTRAPVVPGGLVAATPVGGVIDATLGAFDVLNLETGSFNADFTGSVIDADGPIAVFSGNEASDAPHFTKLADRRCCADHLENQLDPLRTEGKRFAIAHSPSRTRAVQQAGAKIDVVPEPDYVRFVAASGKGATIKTTLPAPDDKIVLSSFGDFREVTVYRDFMAESSDPIGVAQIMASQDAAGVKRGLPGGDPSLLIEPPMEQFRADYVFLTPDKYAFDFVTIVAPSTALVLFDDAPITGLSCEVAPADGLTAKERGSAEPAFVVYRCQISFPAIDPNKVAPDNVTPGLQNDGVHRIVSNAPLGVVVMGFDSYVSYDYAAGTDLNELGVAE
jgi:IgGFc binding protein